jgi:hypothetical protein
MLVNTKTQWPLWNAKNVPPGSTLTAPDNKLANHAEQGNFNRRLVVLHALANASAGTFVPLVRPMENGNSVVKATIVRPGQVQGIYWVLKSKAHRWIPILLVFVANKHAQLGLPVQMV